MINRNTFRKEADKNLLAVLEKLSKMACEGNLEAAKLYIDTVMEHPYYMGIGDDDEEDSCSFE